jgi:hypothetical protein
VVIVSGVSRNTNSYCLRLKLNYSISWFDFFVCAETLTTIFKSLRYHKGITKQIKSMPKAARSSS